jgi:hypothetical protein
VVREKWRLVRMGQESSSASLQRFPAARRTAIAMPIGFGGRSN